VTLFARRELRRPLRDDLDGLGGKCQPPRLAVSPPGEPFCPGLPRKSTFPSFLRVLKAEYVRSENDTAAIPFTSATKNAGPGPSRF